MFILSGLIPWQYFSSALTTSGTSLLANIALVTKVYFPRVLIPFAAVLVPFVDFLLACVVLGGVTVYYGEPIDGPVWPAPAFLLIAIVTALGVGLLLSAVNVRYRDVPYVIPFSSRWACSCRRSSTRSATSRPAGSGSSLSTR